MSSLAGSSGDSSIKQSSINRNFEIIGPKIGESEKSEVSFIYGGEEYTITVYINDKKSELLITDQIEIIKNLANIILAHQNEFQETQTLEGTKLDINNSVIWLPPEQSNGTENTLADDPSFGEKNEIKKIDQKPMAVGIAMDSKSDSENCTAIFNTIFGPPETVKSIGEKRELRSFIKNQIAVVGDRLIEPLVNIAEKTKDVKKQIKLKINKESIKRILNSPMEMIMQKVDMKKQRLKYLQEQFKDPLSLKAFQSEIIQLNDEISVLSNEKREIEEEGVSRESIEGLSKSEMKIRHSEKILYTDAFTSSSEAKTSLISSKNEQNQWSRYFGWSKETEDLKQPDEYAKRVPDPFENFDDLKLKERIKKIVDWKEVWSTKLQAQPADHPQDLVFIKKGLSEFTTRERVLKERMLQYVNYQLQLHSEEINQRIQTTKDFQAVHLAHIIQRGEPGIEKNQFDDMDMIFKLFDGRKIEFVDKPGTFIFSEDGKTSIEDNFEPTIKMTRPPGIDPKIKGINLKCTVIEGHGTKAFNDVHEDAFIGKTKKDLRK